MIQSIVVRSNEKTLKRKFPLGNWGFWYGPDIIRAPSGEFFVCEDNLGYVGGFGDLICARRTLLDSYPEYVEAIFPCDPTDFYREISEHYKSLVKEDEVVVLLHYPKCLTADNEEKRVIKLFKKNKIMPVVNHSNNTKKRKIPSKLVIEKNEDGSSAVYYIRETKKRVKKLKVGLVIIDAEPFDVDPLNKSVKRKIILDEAKYWLEHYGEILSKIPEQSVGKKLIKRMKASIKHEQLKQLISTTPIKIGRIVKFLRKHRRDDLNDTLKQGYPGLLDCYFNGYVKIINGPGFDFIGDKLFCTQMDNIIRFYLKEEPILKTIPTLSFANHFKKDNKKQKEKTNQKPQQPALNEKILSQVFDNPNLQQHIVVKRVDGRGGDAVWVGPKISREEFVKVKEQVRLEPQAFIVQKYIALSQVDGQLVDVRCLGSVSRDSVIVSQTFWGRGVPLDGSNGKVNISDRGFEFTICQAK